MLWGGDFQDLDPKFNHTIIDINIKGITDVAQLGFPLLKATKNSALVNICSASSIYGTPGLAVYSASKFYVRGLTEALNLEWAKHDIRVSSVKPAFVQTAMLDNVPDYMKENIGKLTQESIAEAIYESAQGNRLSVVIGSEMKKLQILTKILPESLSRKLMKRLVNG